MQMKDQLLEREKELFLKMLFNRETTFFWNFIEKDAIRVEISSFIKIRIVSHEAWQVLEFQVFKTLIKTIAEMIKNRIKNDVLKFCYEFYRNLWFVVKKKKKEKYRLINVVLKMNRMIIRNVNLFSVVTNFLKNSLIVLSLFSWICSLNTINCR
jgi:hypothetical protein